MEKLTKTAMISLTAGRQPDWGDFASGLCVGLGYSLAIGGLFIPGIKAAQAIGGAAGITCGTNDTWNIFK